MTEFTDPDLASGFFKSMQVLPETDEDARVFLFHPFTTEYVDEYDALRAKGVDVLTALKAVLQMKVQQLEQEKARLEKIYPYLAQLPDE